MTQRLPSEAGLNPDQELQAIGLTQEALREQARAKLGVVGDQETPPFREVIRKYGLSYYPMIALGLLFVSDQFQGYAFSVLTPDISKSLGISIGAVTAALSLKGLASAVIPLPIAALTQRHARRAAFSIITGVAWSFITLFTGFVTSLLGLIGILVLDGLSTGGVLALHNPLLIDSYHPQARVRALSGYSAIGTLGNVFSPLLVGVLAGVAGFTWRGVFLLMGLLSIAISFFSLRLRDPGFGKWDTEQLRAGVHEIHGDAPTRDLDESEVALGFWEICRRVMLIPTNRRVLAGFAVFGIMLVPLSVFISFFLAQRWNFGPGERGAFFAFSAACGVVTLVLYGRRGEKQFRASPARVVRSSGYALAVAVVLLAAGGLMPAVVPMLICFGLANAATALLGPLLGISMLSIVPANMRAHAQALIGIFTAVGGLAGALLLSSVQVQYGAVGTMITVAIFGGLGALIISSAHTLIESDLDRMIDSVLEDEEIRRIHSGGGRLPMLACRGVDFSYGQLQVLFDVNFTVDDGEMVALLGVNGAGKSTLLKVISGIGLPSNGAVRYRGQEITYLDAERRLRLGITQIPGGRAVFGPMTVVENLRSYGYTMRKDRAAVDRAIDVCFDAFPKLHQRRNSLAAQLSGGEQQMLGLSKALMLRPRLLLIDELSLGLAPIIVGQLLDMVRVINADGTAVVLVEQSVNIALNLVDHAYFMEKGEMRFDGRAKDLLGRDDLLRAVFLQGAGAAS
jgi:ABC-type branched-subunit amino acid transport system ATPase component/MFS family permease